MPSRIQPTAPQTTDLAAPRYSLPTEALEAFGQRVQTILHHDAMSLARGLSPVREGEAITDAQRGQLQAATKDLVLSLPVGALAPGLADRIEAATAGRSFNGRTLAETPLRDLGDVGQTIAKEFVATLKDESPAAYYALATAGAGAVGYVAWTRGSDGLEKLGIHPEAKVRLFGELLAVKAQVDFDPHFKNLDVNAALTSSVALGQYGRLSSQATFGRDGFEGGSISASYARDAWRVSGQANFDRDGFDRASIAASYAHDDWAVNGGMTIEATGRTTASVEANYRPNENFELGVSASHDSTGDNRIGVGLRVRF